MGRGRILRDATDAGQDSGLGEEPLLPVQLHQAP